MDLAKLWFLSGALDGPRALPQEGGLLDQAAVMMDAFSVCRQAAATWQEEKRQQES
jgi:hypothetical protein